MTPSHSCQRCPPGNKPFTCAMYSHSSSLLLIFTILLFLLLFLFLPNSSYSLLLPTFLHPFLLLLLFLPPPPFFLPPSPSYLSPPLSCSSGSIPVSPCPSLPLPPPSSSLTIPLLLNPHTQVTTEQVIQVPSTSVVPVKPATTRIKRGRQSVSNAPKVISAL